MKSRFGKKVEVYMIQTNKNIEVLSKVNEEACDENATSIYIVRIKNADTASFLDTCDFYSRHPEATTFEDKEFEAEVKETCENNWRQHLYKLCDVFDMAGYIVAPGAAYTTYDAQQINHGYFVVTETQSLNV